MIAPGDVVLADVRSSYRRDAVAHTHPAAVLEVDSTRRGIVVARMTTNRSYRTGEPREQVPTWRRIGLALPSYWWSPDLVTVTANDIDRVIGRLTAAAWASLLRFHDLENVA